MYEIGKLEDGSLIYQLTVEERDRLLRREGVRKNRAQCNASIKSIIKDIESKYGLPRGSVRIVNPDTKKAYRNDALIGTIRKKADFDWE